MLVWAAVKKYLRRTRVGIEPTTSWVLDRRHTLDHRDCLKATAGSILTIAAENKSTDVNNATNVLVFRSRNGYVVLIRIIIFESVTQDWRYMTIDVLNFPHVFKGFSNISVSLWIKTVF